MASELKLGSRIGEYLLLEQIRAGAMSVVFKAEHQRMKRTVAIKVSRSDDPEIVGRFLRETELSGRLSHPNVLLAFDAGKTEEVSFLVYRWVEGKDLGNLVKHEGPFAPERALRYILDAARGLHHVHSNGIVHRDVKPANLLLGESDAVLVSDFGLARISEGLENIDESFLAGKPAIPSPEVRLKWGNRDANDFPSTNWTPIICLAPAAGDDASLTQAGALFGTPHFMSPEQTKTAKVDRRADVYGLGCSLFFLLTGRPLYERRTIAEVMEAHCFDPVRSLMEYRHRGLAALNPAFQCMVEKRTSRRYQSMAEVIENLERLLREDRPKARIFISYRRDDAIDAADRLYSELVGYFGDKAVMMDVDSIPSGADYRKYIRESIENCEVLLAVIGNHWLAATDGAGQRRLENADDFVRLEIALALKLGKTIIPVLVGRGTMPGADQLPPELERFAYFNAAEVRAGREYNADIKRLTESLSRFPEAR